MSTDLKKAPRARLVPPYDTGKVKIGLAYAPVQSWQPSRDMYQLQSALLGSRSSIRVTPFELARERLSNLLSLWRHQS